MKKSCLVFALLLMSLTSFSQKLPSQAEIVAKMKFANDYFLASQGTNMGGNMWARAVYYTGNMACYYTTGDAKYLEQSFKWAETYNWQMYGSDPLTRDADMQCCSQTYLELYKIDPVRADISKVRTNIDNMMSTNIINDWTFVDRMYMAMPIFALLGQTTGNSAYYDRMFAMFSDTKDKRGLFVDAEGLWFRDPGVKPPHLTPNGQHEHWSRGNGWSIGAVTRILKIIPANSPYRATYIDVLKKMAAGLKNVQRADGFWNVSLEDPLEFGGPETSGTVFFTYGIAYGINEGYLDKATYLPVVEKAYNAVINTALQADGRLGYCQGPGVRPSDSQPVTNRSTTDYAVGAFLLASAEVYKLTNTNCVPGTLTTVAVSPEPTTINTNTTTKFSAIAYDACANVITATPVWSCTGGTITQTGSYTPNSTGDFFVKATYGAISKTVNFKVSNATTPLLNIALNKPVTTEAEQVGNGGVNLTDGNIATRWAVETAPKWAEIDLGANYDIAQFKLMPYSSRDYKYKIDIKTNGGTSYSTVVDRSANTEAAAELVNNVTTMGRYLRITVTGAITYTGPWLSINELEAYGSLAIPTSTEEMITKTDICLYPNPANQMLNIKGAKTGSLITIYTVQGFKVIETTENYIDVSDLALGLYFLKTEGVVLKFIKD